MTEIKVNGEVVSPASIEQERQQLLNDLSLQNTGVSNDRLKLMILDRARQNVIDHYLFKQEAVARGIEIDDTLVELQVSSVAERNGGIDKLISYLTEINENLDDFRRHVKDRLLVDSLVESIYSAIKPPKDRAAKKYYKEHKEAFNTTEKAEVEHIVKRFKNPIDKRRARAEIEKIESLLRAGKSFKLMVKQKSDNPKNDGKFGWVERGKLGVIFDNFIFAAKPGDLSSPLETADGFYLLKLVDKQESVQQSFDDVKDSILTQLSDELRKVALKEVLDGLQKKAVIEE